MRKSVPSNVSRRKFIVTTGAAVTLPLILPGYASSALPATEASADDFFDSSGAILIAEQGHSDVSWDYSPPREAEVRNGNLEAVLRQMRKDPEFRWTIECVLYFQEWLAAHPESEAELVEFFKKGQLDCGATYTQPLEDNLYGELLARQLYVGKRWFEQRYPGLKLRVVCNQDAPMRSLQSLQLYAKTGVRYLKGSRMATPGFFNWFSPDGSCLAAWYQDGYWGKPNIDAHYIQAQIDAQSSRLQKLGLPPVLGLTWGHDYNDPVDLRVTIDAWNREAGASHRARAAYATFAGVLSAVEKRCAKMPEIHGCVPNWWVYELWPSHHVPLSTQRRAAKDLVAAETFQTIKAILSGSFAEYPQRALNDAWADANFACHTMVPAPAPSAEDLMLAKYRSAASVGAHELNVALGWIATRVKFNSANLLVVVFNRLSWPRTDVATFTLPEGVPMPSALLDDRGRRIPCQLIEGRTICFIADVPAVGYRAFHLPSETAPTELSGPAVGSVWTAPFTSRYYVVTPGAGGLTSIRDRELNRELLNTDRWQAGEWVAFSTDAMGACERIDFNPHPERFLDHSQLHKPMLKCIASGPVFKRWQTPLLKSAAGDAQVSITLFHDLKRIDFGVDIANAGRLGTEQRLLFPLKMDSPDFAYEVPFGVVKPGKSEALIITGPSGTGTPTEPLPSYPREVQDWVYATANGIGVTVGTSVGAVAFRSFGEQGANQPLIAPILLADIRNPQDKQYVQPGQHSFVFSLTSHAPGFENGFRAGIASQNALYAVTATPGPAADLPLSRSFFETSGGAALISAIKKAEDDNDIVVRFYSVARHTDTVSLHCPGPLTAARKTDLLENGGETLPTNASEIPMTLGAQAIETVKLRLAPRRG
jgi:alpha-mannosidase